MTEVFSSLFFDFQLQERLLNFLEDILQVIVLFSGTTAVVVVGSL